MNITVKVMALLLVSIIISCSGNKIDGVYELNKKQFEETIDKQLNTSSEEKSGFEALGQMMAKAAIADMDMSIGIKGDSIFILGSSSLLSNKDELTISSFILEADKLIYQDDDVEKTLTVSNNTLKFEEGEFEMSFTKQEESESFWKEISSARQRIAIKKRKMDLLNSSISVDLTKKGFYEYNYQDYLTFDFVFKNSSNREITAFSGSFEIVNLLDEPVKSIGITFDDPIPANSLIEWNGQTDYNQFTSGDAQLKEKDLSKFKFSFKPRAILFADGEKVEIEN